LHQLTEVGQFRQDLYYRINVIELHMPSLRERPEDIPLLVEHFLRQIAREWQTEMPRMNPQAMTALQQYEFPGNVRELENILERAMTLCEGNLIRESDLRLTGNEPLSGEFTQPDFTGQNLDSALDNTERDAIKRALEQTRYNKTEAAKLLGLSFRQLRYRIKKLGIE
jgi:two-component system response regulator PilR (NtrC family)